MGRVHLEASRSATSVRFTGIVDPLAGPLAAAGVDGSPAIFHDLDSAVSWGSFDAALVAAPSDLHRPIVEQLLGLGVPTLCEKPLGLHLDDASAVAELADRTGVPLQVGYWRRFVPALVELRKQIADGRFGAISLIEAWQWDREPPTAEFRRRSGGIVRDMGVHEIDQTRWLTDEDVTVVSALAADVVSTDPVEGDPESVALIGRLSGGGIAFASVGRRHVDGDACWLEVIGTGHAERVDFMRGESADDVFHAAILAQLDSFATLVNGGPQTGAGAADAVAALAVLESVDALMVAPT